MSAAESTVMSQNRKRVLLSVAYDGTNYCGWQVQKNGETIEGVLNRELSSLFREEITVIGASRTDSGVHALGNVAVFDTAARMPAEKISYALNSRLPEDIRVQRSLEVPADFHPRKTACVKTYEYRILNREFELPPYRMNTYFFRRKLDVERMKAAVRISSENTISRASAASIPRRRPQCGPSTAWRWKSRNFPDRDG